MPRQPDAIGLRSHMMPSSSPCAARCGTIPRGVRWMLRDQSEQVPGQTAVAEATRRFAGACALTLAVGITYFVAARLSLGLVREPDGVAAFWPAAGVASGVLIALGRGAR